MKRRWCRWPLLWASATLLIIGNTTGGAEQAPPALASVPPTSAQDDRAGGDTTVIDDSPTAYGRALANLNPARWQEVRAGKQRFVGAWPQRGPWADASACSDCHYRDGRGPRPVATEIDLAHLLRLGDAASGRADSTYGVQLRRVGYGTTAPGAFSIDWEEIPGRYPSGEPYSLRRPTVRIRSLTYGELDMRTNLSLRVPPATFGLGLLEAVTDPEITAAADPDDRDGDGISGSVQWIQTARSGHRQVGRFGWKAAHSSLAAQSATALAEDIGVTSSLAPMRIGPSSTASMRDGSHPEVGVSDVDLLVGYLRALAPPARRGQTSSIVRQGEKLFLSVGCAACHRPQFTTGDLPNWPELSRQSIRPFTDLLLHDMGAELADGVAHASASGREWRTAPLWGLGLLPIVNGEVGLMHDGRARTPAEAVLWHAGEGARARDRFVALPAAQRAALLKYLESL